MEQLCDKITLALIDKCRQYSYSCLSVFHLFFLNWSSGQNKQFMQGKISRMRKSNRCCPDFCCDGILGEKFQELSGWAF
jgi:hypothetical protein